MTLARDSAERIARAIFGPQAWAQIRDVDRDTGRPLLEVHYGIGGDRVLTLSEHAQHEAFIDRWVADVERDVRRTVALEWFTV